MSPPSFTLQCNAFHSTLSIPLCLSLRLIALSLSSEALRSESAASLSILPGDSLLTIIIMPASTQLRKHSFKIPASRIHRSL